MKIIIIGSIAAGVSAAARLAAAQRGAQITVYEKGGFYSCGTGGLPHYLCEDLDSLNKAIQAKETELNAQGITAHLRHEVRGIDAAARKVTVCDLATGRVFEDHYDKLVLATGSSKVKTDFGYHLIRVDELTGGEQSEFAEVYPQIMQQLTTEKQNKKYMAVRQEMIEKYGLEFK